MSHDEQAVPVSSAPANAEGEVRRELTDHEQLLTQNQRLQGQTAELARAVSLLEATLTGTSEGVLVVDGQARVATCSQRWAELWGVQREQVIGLARRELLERLSAQVLDAQAFVSNGLHVPDNANDGREVVQLKDGRLFERRVRVEPIHGRERGQVWSIRDVSEERRTEQALRDEKRLLEMLNRTGSLINSTLELQSLVQAVTDAATQLSGAKFGAFFYNSKNERGEVFSLYTLSGAPAEAFSRFEHPRATALFGPTFRGEGVVRSDDVTRDPRYGQWAPHHGMPAGHLPVRSYLAVPVISRGGSVLGGLFFGHPEAGVFSERSERAMLAIARQAAVAMDNAMLYEMTTRAASERATLLAAERAARLEVERASVVKDEFLATLSHELRTPLNAILGWSELLLARELLEAQRTGLETIARNARVQAQLVNDLLDMSRIVSGKIRLDVQRVDLPTIIRGALESVRHSAEKKQIALRTVIDPLAGAVAGDPSRLQQAVWNLLSNAVKFTPQGGKVEVLLERVGSRVEVSVHDTGVGISADFLPHVFDRFRQADSSTTRRYGGLGLGLSIVKQLVELHGGSMRVSSDGLGHGASFVMTLPSAAEDEQLKSPSVRPSDVESGIDLSGVRVLVVDDEADARELVGHILRGCGAHVSSADSGSAGLALVKSERPHVILSDIGMPEQDGYAFIGKVRRLSAAEGGRTPAVALTAFARTEDRTRAMLAGFQLHMVKPLDAREVVVAVASLTDRMRPPDEPR
jgi:PAS domain S-box-containing protein